MNRQRGRGNGVRPNSRRNTRSPVRENYQLVDDRFEEVKAKLQASVQKHIKDLESSDEDSDIESAPVLGQVLKSYSKYGGDKDDLGRTQSFLENAFQSGAATCLICIATVKRPDPIWSCIECFCFFHLLCIQRWATDSVTHKKHEQNEISAVEILWTCPNCRHDYNRTEIPQDYYCFCGKTRNPPFQAWLLPHACDATCGRALKPACGHNCLLLCHPGPCPPCPKTVKTSCFCGKSAPRQNRCSNKNWSCGVVCGRKLSCGLHTCGEICHSGTCPPCAKMSHQHCQCKNEKTLRPCASPVWQCKKKCGKQLSCGFHVCEDVCHSGDCKICPRSEPRTCPCGKSLHVLPCMEELPVCGDTCGRILDCGVHTCSRPCHKDKCGVCLEVIMKSCRCGLHKKELPCQKEFLCETKCKRMKGCVRHPCNRKCCDGNCPPCEKSCGRSLACGTHKCAGICHRGPCYPCPITVSVKCRCGATSITVPCGRHKKTKPPRCNKPCSIKPDCHHSAREYHRCHFGDCPPCKQICNKKRIFCEHLCFSPCHSAVWVVVEDNHKPAGPWEKVIPQMQLQNLPCPDCVVPVPVTCIGGHDTSEWPCHMAVPSSCHRPCGRPLLCGNHYCTLPCHGVSMPQDFLKTDENCEICESGCERTRPEGCTHKCPKPCHQGECPPCTHHLRIRCHCTLNQLYVRCGEWTSADEENRITLQSCKNQCPKNYECGHRCQNICHPGSCPTSDTCRKKVKLYCPCHRIRREFPCNVSQNEIVKCDEVCQEKIMEEKRVREIERMKKQQEEERKNQEEVERFERRLQNRRKNRDRRQTEDSGRASDISYIQIILLIVVGLIFAILFAVFRT